MSEWQSFDPVADTDSRLLILGSMPGIRSLQMQQYYGHPQNRFWKILANIYNTELPETIIEKKEFLINQHIAVWDVIASCEIKGSSDSSITNVEVNDLKKIIDQSQITHIYTNGNLADRLYHRYFDEIIDLPVTKLPSSSPANASYSLTKLISFWKEIKSL